MKKILILLIWIAILVSCSRRQEQQPKSVQGSRYDNFIWQTTRISGNDVFIPVPNASVKLCNSPANRVPCTNLVQTFTDITMSVPCALTQQVVLGHGSSCQGTTDQNGAFGFWVPAGTYDYTVSTTTGNYGPYTITLMGGGGGTS